VFNLLLYFACIVVLAWSWFKDPDKTRKAMLVAAVFMKKGVSFFNVLIFIGAWSTTKIPMFLFEMAALGPKFAWTRLAVDIPGIIVMAMTLNKLFSNQEKTKIFEKAEYL
jgi:hypothetical protein